MSRDIAAAIRSEATPPAETLNPLLERQIADMRGRGGELDLDALLKAVSAHYVFLRESAQPGKARERELIAELAIAIFSGAPDTLDPVMRPAWLAASSDAERRRVVIDQVASLTDTSAIVWHSRLCAGS